MLILPFLGWRDQLRGLAKALQNSAVYTLSPAVMRELHRTQTAARLDDDGRNWASVLSSLDPISDIPDLVAAIALLNGAIVGIRTERAGDVHVAQFRHGGAEGREDGAWRDASYESDGTLRLAGILIALMQRPRLSLIAIEEPELHLHPGALRVLRDFLREASEHTQILLTTQSPDLLDLLEPDEIRVVDRVDGVTTVSGISDSLKESVRNRLVSLGELQRIDWLRADHEASVAADRG